MSDQYTRRLTARYLIGEAAQTFRHRFWRVIAVGFVVALVASVLDTLFDRYVEHIEGDLPIGLSSLLVGIAVVITGANTFGSTFLAGVLDQTVGEHQHGHHQERLSRILRTLPYLTLVVADIAVVGLRIAGLTIFIIPGLVVVTLTAIVGPVIIVEKRGALSAIRRSAELTWGAFWLTFRAVTVLMIGEALVSEWLGDLPFAHSIAGHLFTSSVLEVPLTVFVSLIEVTLAYHLIERSRPGTVRAGGLEPPRHEDTGT